MTHATQSHLGAFAHCCKHFPTFTQIPVYATAPVIALGRTLLQDLYSSTPLAATFVPALGTQPDTTSSIPDDAAKSQILLQPPTAEEITKYFSLITPLKYSQPLPPTASPFSPPLEGLTLTAFNSGHTLGGTIWHIQHGMESIVYAVDWNQARENVIGGAAWFGGIGGAEVIEQLRKPTALVCSTKGGDKTALPGGRKKRDDLLLDHIRSSLAKGGSVLIPSDSSARVLELAYMMEKAWHETDDQVIKKAKVYLASRSAVTTMRHARSLLEWMDDSIVREFEGEEDTGVKTHRRMGSKETNGHAKPGRPFEFRAVKLVERKTQFEKMLKAQGPRVIIASNLSLDWGFSKEALRELCQQTENLVLITERPDPVVQSKPSLHQTLWQWFEERQDGVALETNGVGENLEQVHSGGRTLEITDVQRQPLSMEEEQVYQHYIATQRQLQTSLQSRNDTTIDNVDEAGDDASSSSSSDDSDDEHQGRTLNVSAALGHAGRSKAGLSDSDLGVNVLLRRKGVYDFDVRGKKGRNAVFPYVQNRKRGDEFGEFIRPEDYLRAEEKEEDEQGLNNGETRLGQKRKWEDNEKSRGRNKRQQPRRGGGTTTDGDADGAGIADDEAASDSSEDEPEPEALQGPSKALYTSTSVTFNARLAFVDFAGLHDRRSLQMLIPLISPRKLILIGGTEAETSSLAADCKDLLAVRDHESGETATVDILTPVVGQIVDASVDTNAWVVKLSRALLKRLQWQNVRNIGVVTLTGQLKAEQPEEDDDPVKAKKAKTTKQESEQTQSPPTDLHSKEVFPVLDIVPANMAAATRLVAQPVHVGDLRLADLRRLMQTAGHTAEFRGEGTLLIDGSIAVRKLGTGKVVVEGAPLTARDTISNQNSTFYQVRQRIYEGLAVVTGA